MARAAGRPAPREQAPEVLADLLPALRGGRPVWPAVLAACWAVLALGNVIAGNPWLVVANATLALGSVGIWWASPEPRIRTVTADAILLRKGWRTRSIARSDVEDVVPTHGPAVTLVVRDADPVRLERTATRFSAAAAQAAALRRWAGLDDGAAAS